LGIRYGAFPDFGTVWSDWRGSPKNPGSKMATVADMLTQARAGYLALQLGELAVSFNHSNGETVDYNRTPLPRLAAYIIIWNGRQWARSAPAPFNFRPLKDCND
jgi:hypothetical protein